MQLTAGDGPAISESQEGMPDGKCIMEVQIMLGLWLVSVCRYCLALIKERNGTRNEAAAIVRVSMRYSGQA